MATPSAPDQPVEKGRWLLRVVLFLNVSLSPPEQPLVSYHKIMCHTLDSVKIEGCARDFGSSVSSPNNVTCQLGQRMTAESSGVLDCEGPAAAGRGLPKRA